MERNLPALSSLDFERFGVVVARADDVTAEAVPALLSFCEQRDVEMLIARCDGADHAAARALHAAGLDELDAQITYRGPLVIVPPGLGIREGDASDREAVAELARSGFGDFAGHYHADPRLTLDACRDGYVDWALRGLAGEAADVFYVAEVDGQPASYGMFKQIGEDIVSLLSTTAPRARGRGLYGAVLHRGMAWGAERGGVSMVATTGHGNLAVQRKLIKMGLGPVASTFTFHGWRDRLAAGS